MPHDLEFGSDWVFIHINVVLVNGGHDELVALWLHPRRNEGGQIKPRVAIEHQLVIDHLIRRLLWDRLLRHLEPKNRTLQNKILYIITRRTQK